MATPPEAVTVWSVVPLSLNVTLPVGVRLPINAGSTVAVMVTCCAKAGVVVFALKSVDVAIFEGVSAIVLELPTKLVSPA